jgi:hypothetical protein
MSLTINRRTTADELVAFAIDADRIWRYEIAVEDGRLTLDSVAEKLLAEQLEVEDRDVKTEDGDRTESIEIEHHTGSGAPVFGVAVR